MSRIEKLSKHPSYSKDEVALMCGQDIAVVQEWCRNGLDLIDGSVSLYDLLMFIDNMHIEVDETSPLLVAGREQFEEERRHIVGRIFPHFGKVA